MMHASLPSGWHCRPVITLPLAMMRTRARARALLGFHHHGFPHLGVDINGIDLVVGAAVDQCAAPHRYVAIGAAIDALRQLAPIPRPGLPSLR